MARVKALRQSVVYTLLRWGADEPALDNAGNSLEDLLHKVNDGRGTCSQEVIERVRLLLARAPADRAWCRGGWLAVHRSRAPMINTNANAGGEGAEDSDDAGDGAGENRPLAREDVVGVGGDVGGQASSGAGEVRSEVLAGVGNEVFSEVVVKLVELRPGGGVLHGPGVFVRKISRSS